MKNFFTKNMPLILLGAIIISSFGYTWNVEQTTTRQYQDVLLEQVELGAFRPSNYVGKLLTRLDEGGSETTFNTTPGTAADGSTLTTAKIGDFVVFTINPGASNEEKISASAVSVSGTTATWTIINRGLSFTENVAVAANKKQHAIGETVIISNDDHYLSQQFVNVDDAQTITGLKTINSPWIFDADSPPALDETGKTATTTGQFITKEYADNLVNQGAATSTETVAGIAELATQIEMASSTDNGANNPLVLQAKYATSSPPVSGLYTVITNNAGKIAQGFLDLTETFGFTTITSTNATITNLTVSGVTSSVLKTDGSGVVGAAVAGTDYAPVPYTFATTTPASATNGFASTTAFTIPANTTTASSTINVRANIHASNVSNAVGNCTFYLRESSGAQVFTTTGGSTINASGDDVRGDVNVDILADNSTSAQKLLGRAFMLRDESINAVRASYITLLNDTSALDFTSAVNLVGVIESSAANVTCAIESMWIKVN